MSMVVKQLLFTCYPQVYNNSYTHIECAHKCMGIMLVSWNARRNAPIKLQITANLKKKNSFENLLHQCGLKS